MSTIFVLKSIFNFNSNDILFLDLYIRQRRRKKSSYPSNRDNQVMYWTAVVRYSQTEVIIPIVLLG